MTGLFFDSVPRSKISNRTRRILHWLYSEQLRAGSTTPVDVLLCVGFCSAHEALAGVTCRGPGNKQSAICSHQDRCRTPILLICWRYLTANFQLQRPKNRLASAFSGSKSSAKDSRPMQLVRCWVLHRRGPSTSGRMIGFRSFVSAPGLQSVPSNQVEYEGSV
ncbi:hypothetical protein GE21DRAFT_1018391 [Neurospora crassa]|nr:hypothetical protein GE21DRAFT_1018391 [Neurospora crassa]